VRTVIAALLLVPLTLAVVKLNAQSEQRRSVGILVVAVLLALFHPLAEAEPHSPIVIVDGALLLGNLWLIPAETVRLVKDLYPTRRPQAPWAAIVLLIYLGVLAALFVSLAN
jgi:hypothetical protein